MITFEDEILDIHEIVSLVAEKHHDYGDSFERMYEKFGMLSVIIRLNDKIGRLEQFENIVIDDESIEDTLKDIIGYCLLAIRELRK
jgi:hypothetical protein